MALENIMGNIVHGIAVASSLYMAGCGTTLHTQRGEVWYDCNTSEDYPQGHPCYAEVKAYNARMAAAPTPTSSSSDSDRNWGLGANGWREAYSPSKGHCERPKK